MDGPGALVVRLGWGPVTRSRAARSHLNQQYTILNKLPDAATRACVDARTPRPTALGLSAPARYTE